MGELREKSEIVEIAAIYLELKKNMKFPFEIIHDHVKFYLRFCIWFLLEASRIFFFVLSNMYATSRMSCTVEEKKNNVSITVKQFNAVQCIANNRFYGLYVSPHGFVTDHFETHALVINRSSSWAISEFSVGQESTYTT